MLKQRSVDQVTCPLREEDLMIYLVGTDQVIIYIGVDQALFVFSSTQWCPRCGRPAMIFRYRNSHTKCIGCNGADLGDELDSVIVHTLT